MRYPLNPRGGKGDKPRPIDKEQYDKEIDRIYGDYCRLSHKHDKDCKTEDQRD